VVGVVLNVCVASAILDDGGNGGASPSRPATVEEPRPTPTPLRDRTTCEEIRGTEYRSDSEREWFQRNCTTGVLPDADEDDLI
jgi:hypothetical protein